MSHRENSCVPIIHLNVAQDFSGPCQKIIGGHKTIGVPQYNLTVTNPTPPDDGVLRDDAFIPLLDDLGGTLINA